MAHRTQQNEALAIVGVAYRFPGSNDTDHKLWELLKNGRSTWGKVPASRYNQDVYYHPDPQHAGTIAAKGGYFMTEDPAAFDASFFGISPAEAVSLDPQQRYLLETTYECLESAGASMDNVRGSNTGCFAGAFLRDYDMVTNADLLDIPTYAAVGGAGSFLSNRISWFYDFKGPSFTLDTACSSSLVAFHLACKSVWSGECDQALACGANMILMPNPARALTQMQFLSPDGHCYSFDERANGYARGEGFAVLMIKPIAAAIRDGDCIRAVVRASATNQNGRTPGITMPSTEAQARLIRTAYMAAGLDFDTTGYFEAHGTGTPSKLKIDGQVAFQAKNLHLVGDPLEFNAIAQTLLNDSRTFPLIVGSVKSNIGHLEGTAGLAGLVKAILCVEKGMIPPLADFGTPNAKLRLDNPNLKLATTLMNWPSSGIRRASVNSFGAGGSNAHVVIDDALSYLKQHGLRGHHRTIHTPTLLYKSSRTHSSDSAVDSGNSEVNSADSEVKSADSEVDSGDSEVDSGDSRADASSSGNDSSNTSDSGEEIAEKKQKMPKLYVFSAPEQAGLQRMAVSYSEFLKTKIDLNAVDDGHEPVYPTPTSDFEKLNLDQLSQTLGRRSKFDWKSFAVASSATELKSILDNGLPRSIKQTKVAGVAFAFSGQGAQSARMGQSLLQYDVYAAHIREADAYLKTLNCPWSVLDELGRNAASSNVDQARYAQPLSTIIQTGLVDLLRSWGITPKSVVGHSSGEIAAAYACGALSKQDAWKVAYFRGHFSTAVSEMFPETPGAMLAVGLGESEMTEYLEKVNEPNLVIACVNSPHSTTLSGPKNAIAAIRHKLQENDVFQSTLRVTNAYHSPTMTAISVAYGKSIEDIQPSNGSGPIMFSSVTGARIDPITLDSAYWVDNMLKKVNFMAAVSNLLIGGKLKSRRKAKFDVDTILEIGPHSALQTPIKQIIGLEGEKEQALLSYRSVLKRGEDAIETALEVAGRLWTRGHAVDLFKANQRGVTNAILAPHAGLPTYPWNRSEKNRYWHESPMVRAKRHPKVAKSDFLGALDDDNKSTPQFRNALRLEEHPWIADHEIQGIVVLPATSFVVMAIEAAMQTLAEGRVASRIELRDVIVQRPLLFQDRTKAVETRVTLKPHKMGTRLSVAPWTHVTVYSRSIMDGSWNEHSSCYFLVHYQTPASDVEGISEESREAKACQQQYLDYADRCTIKASVTTIYLRLANCGFKYGPMFRNLDQLYSGDSIATGVIRIPDTKAIMPKEFESPHVIHPITLDNAFHLLNPALRNSGLKTTTMLPTAMESIIIDLEVPNTPGTELKGYASYQKRGFHEIMGQITLSTGDFAKPLVTIKNFFCQEVAGIMDLNAPTAAQAKHIASQLIWKEDVERLSASALGAILQRAGSDVQQTLPGIQETLATNIETYAAEADPAPDDGDSLQESSGIPNGSTIEDVPLPTAKIESRKLERSDNVNAELLQYVVETISLQAFKNPALNVLEIDCAGPQIANSLINRLSEAGKHLRMDKYIMTNTLKAPNWVTDLVKQTPAAEYLQLDFADAVDDFPIPNTSVDSIISSGGVHDSASLAQLASKAGNLLKPYGRFSLILTDAPENDDIETILRQSGFTGVDALFQTKMGDKVTTFVTSAKIASSETLVTDKEIILVGPPEEDDRILTLMKTLEELLTSFGNTVRRATLHDLPSIEGKVIISFLGLGTSTLNDLTETEFSAWRSMMLRHSGLLWISAGATTPGRNPLAAMATGALRVMRTEEPHLRLIHLDFSEDMNLESSIAADLVLEVIRTSLLATDEVVETELTERGGSLLIPRLCTHQSANEAIHYYSNDAVASRQKFGDTCEVLQLGIGTSGMLDSLRFTPADAFPKTLPAGAVKVKVTATPINFVDVMIAMGMVPASSLGCECAGIVVEAHEGGRFKAGDQVAVLTGNAFANYIIEDESLMQPIPAGMTPVEAASCATVYVTAYVALIDVARIQKGESVLIHAGAGGLGQAAIQICRMVGAEIFVTVGSIAKKNLLMEEYGISDDHIFNSRDLTFAKGIMRQTTQRGVDVILNSTAGEALRQTWHCIAPFGRFIEVGKRDIMMNTGLDMSPFLRNSTYAGVHIDQMVGPQRYKVADAMRKVFDLLKTGQIGIVHPITTMTYSELEQGFRMVQAGKHTGKVVLTASDDDVVAVVPRVLDELVLKPDVTYAIAGGLGGVGQSIVDSMFDDGARNFAFFSRSGDSKPEARQYLDKLNSRGANARAFKADIGDFESLKAAMDQMTREMPPVKGFINSAMNLRDCLFALMSYEQWKDALTPKVAGTWNFHKLLPDGLDFFLTMSSISAIMGAPGQTNYAAANAYQDALAHYRRSKGQVATSINFSAIVGIGVFEESKDSWSSYFDLIAINEMEVNALAEFAMKTTTLAGVPMPTHLTTGINPVMLNVPGLLWCHDPKFRMIRRKGDHRSIAAEEENTKSKVLEELANCTTLAAAAMAIEHGLVLKLSKSMMCEPGDINTQKPLHSFGVDSLVAVEVRNWIFKELKSEVTVFDIMDPQPASALCYKIAERSKLISAEIKALAKEEE